MPIPDDYRRRLSQAQQEALQVHDSPLRADQLAARVVELTRRLAELDVADELRSRLRAALADAERVLRRDDDGREAARHLQAALHLAEERTSRPSPFLDDDD